MPVPVFGPHLDDTGNPRGARPPGGGITPLEAANLRYEGYRPPHSMPRDPVEALPMKLYGDHISQVPRPAGLAEAEAQAKAEAAAIRATEED